jgi:hypothetical protein
MKHVLCLILCAIPSVAQTRAATITLTWVDDTNPAVTTTYKVERAPGICAGTLAFSTIQAGLTVKTYKDPSIASGQWCYQIRASLGGLDSPPSPQAQATIGPAAPSRLDLVIQ